ncbi:MAG: sortase [Defluviitaleaceae bacterium]|nr:sortase [Defluviitaleaceae bacterium]
MKNKASLILIAAGAALFFTGAGLAVSHRVEDYLAGERARKLLEQMELAQVAPVNSPVAYHAATAETGSIDSAAEAVAAVAVNTAAAEENAAPEEDTAEAEEDITSRSALAYNAAGVLNIPKLNLMLPVLSEWNYDLLKVSVCVYSGGFQDKPQRLVIIGHNYRSHFGRIHTLDLGDELILTAIDGTIYRYGVIEITKIFGTDSAALQACDEWDVTLMTCAEDNTMRVLVRYIKII